MIKLRHRLSLRIFAILSLTAVPVLAAFALWVVRSESAEIEELTVSQGRVAALAGARAYGAILDIGVASGDLRLEDLLHPTYLEIRYPGLEVCPISDLSPDSVQSPAATGKAGDPAPPAPSAPCLEDPRYRICGTPDPNQTARAGEATPRKDGESLPCEPGFDAYTDQHGIQGIEDAILASNPAFLFASGIDRGGYVPTPHKKYDEKPTGDPAHDRAHSRQKRKYPGEPLLAAGFISSRHEPTQTLLYTQDTGKVAIDAIATIFVGGRPFGAFRVGVSRDGIVARQRARILTLVPIFALLALALASFAFLLLRWSIRPLEHLSARADLISAGEDLGVVLRSERLDEIGMVTRSINRLRASLDAAMQRLGE